MSAPTKCQSKFDAAHPASLLNYNLIDRHMIDSYFAVARQKGRDKDRRAALIWINLLETFSIQLNERPRESLQFETPAERFNACIASTRHVRSPPRQQTSVRRRPLAATR